MKVSSRMSFQEMQKATEERWGQYAVNKGELDALKSEIDILNSEREIVCTVTTLGTILFAVNPLAGGVALLLGGKKLLTLSNEIGELRLQKDELYRETMALLSKANVAYEVDEQ